MAATSGLCAVAGKDVATDLINHILVNSGTVATAVTITGPNKVALLISSSTNKTSGLSVRTPTTAEYQSVGAALRPLRARATASATSAKTARR